MADGKVSVVVYSTANMNAIDGSSVWVQTVTLALAEVERITVSILLSHPVASGRLLDPLTAHPGVSVIDPFAVGWTTGHGPLTLDEAADLLVSRLSPDAVVVRGSAAVRRLAAEPGLQGKLWPYLTDVPQHVLDVDNTTRDLFAEVMAASPVLLCQTEGLRTFLEGCYPEVAGRGWLLPPTIPEGVEPRYLPPPTRHDLRLCYSGKFARRWNTLEMCEIPGRLADMGIEATLTMVGDKINRDPDWPEFVPKMRKRLQKSPGVDWVGGVSRERSIELMSEAHVGLSWRSPELDDSLELSTKLLEYCAAGTPPLLNRTAMHEAIFGTDYPLFVNSEDDVIESLVRATDEPSLYQTAIEFISDIAAAYTLENTADRLGHLVERVFRTGDPGPRPGAIDIDGLHRAKMENARFHIAWFISETTRMAELEQAATLIELLRSHDLRMILFVAGNSSHLESSDARQSLQSLLHRAGPNGVVFDGERPARSAWLRKIGFVVGFGTGLGIETAQAMASGSVPVLLRGIQTNPGRADKWMHETVEVMADHILVTAETDEAWHEASDEARNEAAGTFAHG